MPAPSRLRSPMGRTAKGVAPNIAPDVPAHRNFHIGYVVAAVVLVPAAVAYAAQQQVRVGGCWCGSLWMLVGDGV